MRPGRRTRSRRGRSISIHAPLAGCDWLTPRSQMKRTVFQSTHPLRGATGVPIHIDAKTIISIHAPLAGCDELYISQAAYSKYISIHAPLAGCDAADSSRMRSTRDFNPRTPCGVRLQRNYHTTPDWVLISIHAPLAGCDYWSHHHQSAGIDFNPRTPCGVRPEATVAMPKDLRISIHAPLAGCDSS